MVSKNDGKLLEHVIAEMCSGITDSKVTHNAKIVGKLSNRKRQIDVLVCGKFGFMDIVVEIEAKDYKRPVSIVQVESFISKVEDTGADLGVMVCTKGFDAGAKARAAAGNIQLFEVFSEKLENTPFFIPVRMVIPEISQYAVGFSHRAYGPFSMPSDLSRIRVVVDNHTFDLKQLLLHAWNSNKIPMTAGTHKVNYNVVTIKDIQNPNYTQYCEVYFNVTVKETFYLKIFPANFLKNVKDSNSKYYLTLPLFSDPQRLNEEWQQFSTLEEMNKAADIENQPQDVQNLLIKPFYTMDVEQAKFDPNG